MSNSSSSVSTGSQWVWVRYVLVFSLLAVSGALVRLTIWSFLETRDWFMFLNSNETKGVALAMAVIFQFGQSPVLYVRSVFQRRKRELTPQVGRASGDQFRLAELKADIYTANVVIWGAVGVFAIFAIVDAWTNYVEMNNTLAASAAQGLAIGADKKILVAVVAVVAVFFEELLGYCFSLACNIFNDIRQIHGKRRIAWIDSFADQAKSISGMGDRDRPSRPAAPQSFDKEPGPTTNTAPAKATERTQFAPTPSTNAPAVPARNKSAPNTLPTYKKQPEASHQVGMSRERPAGGWVDEMAADFQNFQNEKE